MNTSSATPPRPAPSPTTVALVTLGCARNEVDSEELAGRLETGGFALVDDAESAEMVVVNTCGFVEAAKKDSVDTLLAAADLKESGTTQAVVAVGCLAERYGAELAGSLPEADAVLGFDAYPDIADRLRSILAGEKQHPHTPSDRRKLLPISPAERAAAPAYQPGHAERRRLDSGPMAPLKLASGCDRRCTFCAIPAFRGSFVSRRPSDVLAEARWLAGEGARELFLVSENSTSYGKDLGDLRLLETLLPELAAVEGVERVRVSYLQPAETRPGLVTAIARTPGVAAYFDLSFQHASHPVLRRMRRFGDAEAFLGLLDQARAQAPLAGARSNFIVGFPGETEEDLETLCDFLSEARLDAIGVFGYSDEDGTEAEGFEDKHDEDEIAERVAHVTALAEELTAQRAEERIGEGVLVLVESTEDGVVEGRAAHQGPEVDGSTILEVDSPGQVAVGEMITARVVGTDGVDLVAPSDRTVEFRADVRAHFRADRRDGAGGGSMSERDPSAVNPQVSNWNVPNALTTLRIVMVPFFGWALLHDGGSDLTWRWVAWVLFCVAMITDKIDGDLARKHNLVTDFGKIADPIADKAMTGMAFIGLAIIADFMPAWLWWTITVIVLVREWAVTIARLSIAKDVVMPAKQSGKVKTMLQAVALGGFIAPFGLLTGAFEVPGDIIWWISALLLAVAVVLTITSGVEFARDVVRQRAGRPAPAEDPAAR